MAEEFTKKQKIAELIKKINSFKKKYDVDLSSQEDLSVAIMNLISIEEHLFFSGAKTGKEKYYDLLGKVREIRKELLKKIVKDAEGEVWCISKHLLAASMRLIEVGTKYWGDGKKKEAEDLFSKAYNLYSLFWGINLKAINLSGNIKNYSEKKHNPDSENKDALMKRLNNLVEELINCCDE